MNIDIKAGVLDFPRKKLPDTIWVYQNPDDLPKLNPSLRQLIINNATNYLQRYNLDLEQALILGGAASYQWTEGADIDVSLYANGWPEDITYEERIFIQKQFKDIEVPFQEYPIHFFLNNPDKSSEHEVAEAVYDVTEDEWVLPPLVLPQGFDPDKYFAPLIKVAEEKAKKFDLKIGRLRRMWKSLEKASASKGKAKEPKIVERRIKAQKEKVKSLVGELATAYEKIREKRYVLHDKLREKMQKDIKVGRFERFQEPEIVWKYLDRAHYLDFLKRLYDLNDDNMVDNILAKF